MTRDRVELLEGALQEAHAWTRQVYMYEHEPPFYQGTQWWSFPAGRDFGEAQCTN